MAYAIFLFQCFPSDGSAGGPTERGSEESDSVKMDRATVNKYH